MNGDWKALYSAVQSNNFNMVKLYVGLGCDVNFQHPEIMTTVLIEACRQKNFEISKYLLENNADPTIEEDFGGETPLSVAISNKDKNIISLLEKYLKK
jgi:uncharacterized protein